MHVVSHQKGGSDPLDTSSLPIVLTAGWKLPYVVVTKRRWIHHGRIPSNRGAAVGSTYHMYPVLVYWYVRAR